MSRKQSPAVVLLLVVLVWLLNPASLLASSIVSAPGDGGDVPGQGDVGDITLELPRRYYKSFLPVMRWQVLPDGNCTHYVDNMVAMDGDGSWNAPWDNIAAHVNDLEPGDVMCVRGEGPGARRVYAGSLLVSSASGARSGTREAPIVVRSYPGERVVLRSAGRYIVDLRGVDWWRVEGLAIDRQSTGGFGVNVDDADWNVLSDCEIYGSADDGVHIDGDHNLVTGCRIHDNGTGMFIVGGIGNVIRDSEIYDNRGDGIQVYHYHDVADTVIENNHIYTTLGKCSENGIDLKVGSATIRGNTMHGWRYCDASCGGSGGGIGAALTVHNEATNVVIEGNEIFDSASGIVVEASNSQVVNNLIHDLVTDDNAWANIGIYVHDSIDVTIVNNTVANVPRHALWIGPNVAGLDVRNNLFYNVHQIGGYFKSAVTADYNGWFSAAESIAGPHDVVGNDPYFVSPGDYHLCGLSPAVDVGDTAHAPLRDFDDNPRPYGPAVDLGAFELQEPPPVVDLRVSEGVTTTESVTVTLARTAPGRVG